MDTLTLAYSWTSYSIFLYLLCFRDVPGQSVVIIENLVFPLALRTCKEVFINSQAEIKRVQADYAVRGSKTARAFSFVDISFWGVPNYNGIRTEMGISPKPKAVI